MNRKLAPHTVASAANRAVTPNRLGMVLPVFVNSRPVNGFAAPRGQRFSDCVLKTAV